MAQRPFEAPARFPEERLLQWRHRLSLTAGIICCWLSGIAPAMGQDAFDDGAWIVPTDEDGFNGDVRTVVAHEGVVYVGGTFTSVDGVEVNYVAKRDGTGWHALGEGFNNDVRALAVSPDGTLYAGGRFTAADGSPANRVAKWTGEHWMPLGAGIPHNQVYALAVDAAGNLYVGGTFHEGGGSPGNRVAKWDGESWSALGAGFASQTVHCLVIDRDGILYAGGNFSGQIAKWNGTEWIVIGADMESGVVYTILPEESGSLYAGGSFGSRLARWNGSEWLAVGSGFSSGVIYALASDPAGYIYAGGSFSSGSGHGISRWDGATWTPLGSGIAGTAHSLLYRNGLLVVGGAFTQAGGEAAANLATVVVTRNDLQLMVVSGDEQTALAGNTLSSPLVVQVRDDDGNPVADATVSFRFGSWPTGATGYGLSTSAATTSANGEAAAEATLGTKAGDYLITAAAGGAETTFTARALPGDPAKITVLAQPEAIVAGEAIAGSPTVLVEDQFGNPVAGVAVSASGAPFVGGETTVETDAAGLAVFPDLVVTASGSYALLFSLGTGETATTGEFDVTAGPAVQLTLTAEMDEIASGATCDLTAVFRDSFGNSVSSGDDAALDVAFSKVEGTGTVSGLGAVKAEQGVAVITLTGLLPGPLTIRAESTTSDDLQLQTDLAIDVVPAAPSDILLTSSTLAGQSPAGTAVGALSAIDPGDDTHAFSLVPGDGDTDNAAFEISGAMLLTTELLDASLHSILHIRVRATNSHGRFTEKQFAITVLPNGEDVTILTDHSVGPGEEVAITGTLTVGDPEGTAVQYTVHGGTLRANRLRLEPGAQLVVNRGTVKLAGLNGGEHVISGSFTVFNSWGSVFIEDDTTFDGDTLAIVSDIHVAKDVTLAVTGSLILDGSVIASSEGRYAIDIESGARFQAARTLFQGAEISVAANDVTFFDNWLENTEVTIAGSVAEPAAVFHNVLVDGSASITIAPGASVITEVDGWSNVTSPDETRNNLQLNVSPEGLPPGRHLNEAGSLFLQPGDVVAVDLDLTELLDYRIQGVEAMLGFSTEFFEAATGELQGVAPWIIQLHDFWGEGPFPWYGQIDTGIGLDLAYPDSHGTQESGAVAKIRLEAADTEGITSLFFRLKQPGDHPAMGTRLTAMDDGLPFHLTPFTANTGLIVIDGTPPTLESFTALQEQADDWVDLFAPGSVSRKGTVHFAIDAFDALAGVDAAGVALAVRLADDPLITLPATLAGTEAVEINGEPWTRFLFEMIIDSGTPNGLYEAEIQASDRSGNSSGILVGSFAVNKNEIGVTVQLEGAVDAPFVREVVFVATDTDGQELETWVRDMTFSNGSGSDLLEDVPQQTAHLSAKTPFTLRRRVPLEFDSDGQAIADFSGGNLLLGGDLTGDNLVDMLDFAILRSHWFTSNGSADITGDGGTNAGDLAILRANWLLRGDDR